MIAGVVLVALVLTVRFTTGRRPRAGYVLMAVAVLWLLVDKAMEGPTVLYVSPDHGLTAADLAGLVGLALGLRQAWPDVVRRSGWLTRR
ncbi:MAG: hypothetical protein QM747_08855 [Nocardioides sp.]